MGSFVTTERHYATFKAEARRLVKLWGLNNWRVDFSHERLKGDVRAQCRRNAVGHTVSLVLGIEWAVKDGNGDRHYAPNDRAIRECARHEVIHLLLAELACLAHSRYATSDEIEAAEESLCRRMHELLPR